MARTGAPERESDAERLRSASDAELLELADALCELDRDLRVVRLNARYEEITGQPRLASVGRRFFDLWPEGAGPDAAGRRELLRAMAERVPVEFDQVDPARGRWLRVAARPTSTGGLVVFLRAGRDEEDALRRYELLASLSRDIVLFMRRDDGRILEANAAAVAAYGYTHEELLGLRIGDLRAPASAHLTEQQMAEAEARGILFETAHRRKDGSTFEVEVSSRGATVAGTRTLISVIRDIGARRVVERALRESEERFRSLFANMTEGFALGEALRDGDGVPRDFRFLEMNEAFERQLGLDRARARGRPMREVLPGLEQSWVDTYCGVALGGPARRFESYNRDLDRHFDVYCFSPSPGRFAILFNDVTERRRMEQELRASDRRKTEFLAVLSHELRNPLTPIQNALVLLDRAAPGSDVAGRARDVLHRQAAQLTRLVDDLLDLSRITHGKIEVQLARLDAREVVRRAFGDAREMFDGRGVALALREDPAPLWVDADDARLLQMVGNVLHNALKFTPRGGRVELEASRRGSSCEVRVRDTGAGIDPAELDRIFEPFVQGERTGRGHGGLGLGLALVRELAAKHGGTVAAHSAGAGQGAEIVIALPLARPPEGVAPARAGDAGGAPLAVVIVEDNEDAGVTLAEVLALDGHGVVRAATGAEGLRALAAGPADVLLCDIGLPDMSGHAVVRAARALPGRRGLYAVALTGYALPEDRAAALAAGFDEHLAKPPELDVLRGLLADVARRRAPPPAGSPGGSSSNSAASEASRTRSVPWAKRTPEAELQRSRHSPRTASSRRGRPSRPRSQAEATVRPSARPVTSPAGAGMNGPLKSRKSRSRRASAPAATGPRRASRPGAAYTPSAW